LRRADHRLGRIIAFCQIQLQIGGTEVHVKRIHGTGKWRNALAITSAVTAAATGLMFIDAPAHAREAKNKPPSPFARPAIDSDHDGDADLKAACSAPAHPRQAACFAIKVADLDVYVGPNLTPLLPAGYSPPELQRAYSLPSSRGSGRTVAIIDAYDDPKAESDLATYRRTYGLSACTTANGCFRKVNQNGGTSYPRPDSGWGQEISLDLDMVSAICPNCHILLVEASSSYLSDLGKAVNRAVTLGARFVSNSYGAYESSSDPSYDKLYFNHPGVAITVSSGDGGYAVSYPASSRYVTAVGGTSLRSSGGSRGFTESVWGNSGNGGTGSGCSAYDAKPTWQTDTGCSKRTTVDVSAVADPDTGVAVYDSQTGGWAIFGGTSASAPIIAATYALAGTPAWGSYPSSYPYAHPQALHDVTSGSNGSCTPSYLCTARVGYDGPTGLGTPNGYRAFAP
jgi:hypothetical protein